ncbi:APA family basic amino acid/polyamine antiporter [Kineosphaera limosa]|uniref:Putative amino acid transporter n=1 Tax=Kineosphaera limosa NBRC 100340 TaxID=1184609 RepID=K6X7C1_9MICO|nr:amino acid permease [Kineosphaera limosa]NYD99339.1 APA family basic amino acid/polyamine antiporter [Kineosphaera limosa]GAB94704.1 putative amino acid transporter [Kineosphaera limosa NBRC 100340]
MAQAHPQSAKRRAGIFRTKSIEESLAETTESEYSLKKRLTALDLTVFGVGVIIGAGIFTLTGRAAATVAGPAVLISFIIAAVCCGLAALCYAEFASTVPVSGSAYTFSYATLGEFVAWIIGWDLLLELMLGSSVVAQGWSAYAGVFLGHLGIEIPKSVAYGSSFDLPAFLLVAVLTALVCYGIKESLRVNLVLVGLKLFVVLFVIFAGIGYINTANYTPFIPPAVPASTTGGSIWTAPLVETMFGMAPSAFGVGGVLAGASLVFFAYIGFDVVATTAEEAKNPQRDLPIGIIASLVICTILYCAVTLVITGMIPYQEISTEASLATAFEHVGRPEFATIISAGAVAGLTTVVMTLLIGATRVTFAMSRDWLLPASLGTTNPRTGTPIKLTLIIGTTVAFIAAFTPVGKLEEMVNIGTLAAFTLVSIAVPILRRNRPDLKRSFQVPGSPFVPWLAAAVAFYLMLTLPLETWVRFIAWMVLGLIIYFVYGMRRSRLAVGAHDIPAPDYSAH